MKNRIKREQKIFLHPVNENTFEVNTLDNQLLISADEEYFIYFKNVYLREFGIIEGRYLGENPHNLIDEHCREISYSVDRGQWVAKNGKPFRTARMVAVNNKTGVTIIIE